MTSRNWVKLFFNTLLLGGVVTLIVSFFVKSDAYMMALQPFNAFELLGVMLTFLGFGFIFSVISQMGFFAYLTVHRFGLGIFKSYWIPIQIGLILFAVFDLVYFPYQKAAEEASIWPYILTATIITICSVAVAYVKAQQTNQKAFIPALFFMIVVTAIEWVPAINVSDVDYTLLMIFPLFACNAYQLLLLHKLNSPQQSANSAKHATSKK
ncbi:KinB-signaling pathway activation protein [Pontibacillus litoralis]|uniref:KinB-signaling pathway activation protein n=1 Tax=Pontibacillus litoralis JSM 072002 TaxID=1385512 RepID=A0A0A5FUC2_9BACI|nr:KinB-signaling pathway activation protein [Pontibacillus litoralis]KGX84376.1 KinB-signaling pathway activation protein [Pontibacillus litoralis JSM 072002]